MAQPKGSREIKMCTGYTGLSLLGLAEQNTSDASYARKSG